ncbi:uncharacterized protein LOC130791729 isoform X3 [Actinidia eriantha]|uniref:uncharacterized protein LOC130791729 isoform X3 n=1 Tax=Actinidia eriantha TaxID=165200 RepID=UPI002585AC91|nr:uncharacterized protein LOC130791729 isoform X3 [Actinidia eriantha]
MGFIGVFLLLLALFRLPLSISISSALNLSNAITNFSTIDGIDDNFLSSLAHKRCRKKHHKKHVMCNRNPKCCKRISKHHSCCFKHICVNVYSNPFHCGFCGHVCKHGTKCCNGVCVDTRKDRRHCGMNRATRPSASVFSSQANPFNIRASLFHSTPVLDRRRRTHWDSGGGANRDSSRPRRFNHYSNRYRKLNSKHTLLRNVSALADQLFQSWQNGFDEYDSSSRQNSSWFRREYEAKDCKRGWTSTKGPHSSGRRAFHFCEDDDDIETIFRSACGGNRHFYWSFVGEDFPRWKSSSGFYNTNQTSWNWRHRNEEDYDSSSESDSSESDMMSDRVALGLSASGSLKLDDVKNAYRACALKWHPDRHHGSSKAVAEEKFKACSAAYQSICDKLALN